MQDDEQLSIPGLQEVAASLMPQDAAILQEAIGYFDGSYRSLMDHLKSLGASKSIYAAVNGAAKDAMGKGRSQANREDVHEMLTWGDGYNYTEEVMPDLENPYGRARGAFEQAKEDNQCPQQP
ncbi:MAG: hypothetical protein F6K30_27680 [Cyanothece sp. SIO2G6]|nr:hypothetical protein [Cyanothece sp. SIO2G6]